MTSLATIVQGVGMEPLSLSGVTLRTREGLKYPFLTGAMQIPDAWA